MVLSIVGLVYSMKKNPGEAYSATAFPARWVAVSFEAFSMSIPMALVLLGCLFVLKELRQRRNFLSFKKTHRNFMEVTDRPVEEPDEEEIEDAIMRREQLTELFKQVNDGTMTAVQLTGVDPDKKKTSVRGLVAKATFRLRRGDAADFGKDGVKNEDPNEVVKYGRGMFRIYFQVSSSLAFAPPLSCLVRCLVVQFYRVVVVCGAQWSRAR